MYNGFSARNRCWDRALVLGAGHDPSLALKLTKYIERCAGATSATYACNTSSRLIYLVWIIVKECQDTTLRRAPLPRAQFQLQSRILVARRDVGERSPRTTGALKSVPSAILTGNAMSETAPISSACIRRIQPTRRICAAWARTRLLVPSGLVRGAEGGQDARAPICGAAHCAVSRQKRAGVRVGGPLRPPPGALHLGVVSGDESSATITLDLQPHGKCVNVPYLGADRLPTG